MLDLQQDSTPLIEHFSRYYDGIDKMPTVIHEVKYVTEAEPFLPAWEVNSDFVFISIWKWNENSDGIVDIVDLVFVGRAFVTSEVELPADVNSDGTVDIADLMIVGAYFGETTN